VRTFLKGGSASPRLDGDVAPAAAWASKSYWISGQGVRGTFSLLMPTEGSSTPPPLMVGSYLHKKKLLG
jgi:hypothetical protein